MKRIFKREESLPGPAIPVVRVGVDPRQFQSSFPGLSAAVAEKYPLKTGNFCELLRQLCLELVIEKIRDVNQLSGLALQHTLDRRMPVTESINADAAQEIEIALAF
jgi:hypothetical protein